MAASKFWFRGRNFLPAGTHTHSPARMRARVVLPLRSADVLLLILRRTKCCCAAGSLHEFFSDAHARTRPKPESFFLASFSSSEQSAVGNWCNNHNVISRLCAAAAAWMRRSWNFCTFVSLRERKRWGIRRQIFPEFEQETRGTWLSSVPFCSYSYL